MDQFGFTVQLYVQKMQLKLQTGQSLFRLLLLEQSGPEVIKKFHAQLS